MPLKGPAGEKRGSKAALRLVLTKLPQYRFVLKTDIRDYYFSVEHRLLLDRLAPFIPAKCDQGAGTTGRGFGAGNE